MELKISGIGAIIAESKGSLAKYKENKTYDKPAEEKQIAIKRGYRIYGRNTKSNGHREA